MPGFVRKQLMQNAPANNSLLIHEFLAKNKTVIMTQCAYLSDMAHCDFFLFLNMKKNYESTMLCQQ